MLSATFDRSQTVASITAGGKTADYTFTRTAGGWLVGPVELPDSAAYRVSDAGSCTCPAGQFGKACKHVAAVAKLVERRVLAS